MSSLLAQQPATSGRGSGPRRVAILGCGTVGREVAARLLETGERLGLEVVAILVRDAARDRGLPPSLFTASIAEVEATAPDLVVELIGGVDVAGALAERFLANGVPVVTANKTLIAHRGPALAALAAESGTEIAFEASVCAAIPIIAALRHLAGDRVLSIRGVVNGSCNFILSRLNEGWRSEDALAEARKRGLVEPDPSADISGRDSAEKLCVLAAAIGVPLAPDRIQTRGIESLTPDDLLAARRSGQTIKLLAELDVADGTPLARVGPALLPRSHPLAQAEDEENAVAVVSVLGGELVLRGRGAGPRPTASAVLGDVVRLARLSRAKPGERMCPSGPAAWPAQRHSIRLSGPTPDPTTLGEALREQGVEAEEVAVNRDATRILTEPATPGAAAACGESLSRTRRTGPALVMPVLG